MKKQVRDGYQGKKKVSGGTAFWDNVSKKRQDPLNLKPSFRLEGSKHKRVSETQNLEIIVYTPRTQYS